MSELFTVIIHHRVEPGQLYQSLPLNSKREWDKVDVIELLKIAHLGEDFADKLHRSVRDTYNRVLSEIKAITRRD